MLNIPPRDERGSMIIAISIMTVLLLLGAAILARTNSTMKASRQTGDFAAALGQADSGLSDAMFKLDQGVTGTFTGGGGSTPFRYTATQVNGNTFTVQSLGTSNNVPHGIQATVSRKVQYPYALYTKNGIDFGTGSPPNIFSCDPGTCTWANPTGTGKAYVGSSGAIRLTTSGANRGGDRQDYYAPGGSCASTCSNPNGPLAATDAPTTADVTAASIPVGALPCPSLLHGAVIAAGTYVCRSDLTFGPAPGGTQCVVSVGGPVIIYAVPATPGGSLNIYFNDCKINDGGDSTNFRILKGGPGSINTGSGNGTMAVTGVLYAPLTTFTPTGAATRWTGALVLNKWDYNGQSGFTFAYDLKLNTLLTQDWHVSDYKEIPSAQVP
jgi:Tfp pilus assembly protein PilX